MSSRTRRVACLSFLLALLASCASGTDPGDAGTGGNGMAEVEQEVPTGRVAEGIGDVDSGADGSSAYALSTDESVRGPAGRVSLPDRPLENDASGLEIGPAIIKTATIRVAIDRDNFEPAVHTATTVAERYGGYVVSTTVDDHGEGFAAATLRVPSDKFGSALGAVRGLGEVRREEIGGEDVTQQVIDLEARLRNLSAQETVLLRLMNEANTVLDTIRVQQHLTDVQLEIERTRGRLRYLDDQVSFSTIFVEMTELGAGAEPKLGALGRAWQQALDGALSVIGGVIVGAGFAAPLALLALAGALVFKAVRPKIRRVPTAAG